MGKPRQAKRAGSRQKPPQPRLVNKPLPLMIGQIPLTLTSVDMVRVFQLTKRTFYRHQSLGRFRRFELKDRARTNHEPRYSGPAVMRFLEAVG
jgi:hypothetical protein